MFLSDGEIIEIIQEGKLTITPITNVKQIQSASVDITLGDSFSILDGLPKGAVIHMNEDIPHTNISAPTYLLSPGQFILATTKEYISLPDNVAAMVNGKSSVGRLGLFIQNAGWIDPGFEGELTLELFNASKYPIELKAGYKIGQLTFARMERDAITPYQGKYKGQRGATSSRMYMDFTKEKE